MTESRWFALMILIGLLGSAMLAASCGDDDDDDDATADDDAGDDDAADDDADDDSGGQCTTSDLCVPISECDYGFTQEACEESFLSFCAEGGDVDSYLTCVCDFVDAYATDGDCSAFYDAEISCWEVAGC